MAITMDWSRIGVGSVVAFLIGWFLFGLLGAIVVAIVVLLLLGVLRISTTGSRTPKQDHS